MIWYYIICKKLQVVPACQSLGMRSRCQTKGLFAILSGSIFFLEPLNDRSQRKDCSQAGTCFNVVRRSSGETVAGKYGKQLTWLMPNSLGNGWTWATRPVVGASCSDNARMPRVFERTCEPAHGLRSLCLFLPRAPQFRFEETHRCCKEINYWCAYSPQKNNGWKPQMFRKSAVRLLSIQTVDCYSFRRVA